MGTSRKRAFGELVSSLIAAAESRQLQTLNRLAATRGTATSDFKSLADRRLTALVHALDRLWADALAEEDESWADGSVERVLGYLAYYFDECLREIRLRMAKGAPLAVSGEELFSQMQMRSLSWDPKTPQGLRVQLTVSYASTMMFTQFL